MSWRKFTGNMQKMDYKVRAAKEQDIPAILELFELSLGTEGGAPVESFWRWKHINNPFGVSPVLLAFDNDKLIGLRAFMRWQWRYKGEILPAFRAVDTATHPDYRGKGIFSKLTKALIEELEISEPASFIYNTPNTQSKPGYLKMGWKVLGKPNVKGSIALTLSKDSTKRFETFQNDLKDIDFESISFKPSIHIDSIHTNQSLLYYKWRYQSIPEIPYGAFTYTNKKKSVMLFFHLKSRARFNELRICDEIWSDGFADQKVSLEAYHVLAHKLGTPIISFITAQELSLWKKLSFRIFSLQKYAPEITIREVNSAELFNTVQDVDNWSYNMGDLELF
jgi:GNAT superfamily N-acetyltransferase